MTEEEFASLCERVAHNGINHTTPQVDRAVPPGSFAQWNALVESSVWHR